MIRFLTDECLHGDLVRAMQRHLRDVDWVRAQDMGLMGAKDPVLQWAAEHGRILLTHDLQTIPHYANDRVRAGLHMPGVLIVRLSASIAAIVDELCCVAACSEESEWDSQVRFLTLD